MKKIASFTVDHTKFGIGMYISRVDGDIVTYDIRMKKPNGNDYLPYAAMHTIEHLFATFARNSGIAENVIYVGPMGCRTGFYLLLRDTPAQKAIEMTRAAMEFVASYNDVIPGLSAVECGNYLEHDLEGAKLQVKPIIKVLENYTTEMLEYSWHYNQ